MAKTKVKKKSNPEFQRFEDLAKRIVTAPKKMNPQKTKTESS